ncbi:MAG TPA: type II secretion system protein [Ilumatobacteraceae bacterium]|jgi:type II secretory pathway pseudopilin PulG
MRTRNDAGETLVEIMFTIVIISLTVTALLSSLGTVGRAGNAQRNGVRADSVLRNYAEAIKSGAQQCTVGGTYTVAYTAPTGFTPSVLPADNTCPPVSTPKLLVLKVTGPLGLQETLQIKVSTP